MNITIDDLKRFSEIYDSLIDRADILIRMQSEINKERDGFGAFDIYEVTKDQIAFRCEDRWGDNAYIYFTFDDFISENYFERYKKSFEEQQEKKRIAKEQEEKERLLRLERQERETLEKLKAKYENQ